MVWSDLSCTQQSILTSIICDEPRLIEEEKKTSKDTRKSKRFRSGLYIGASLKQYQMIILTKKIESEITKLEVQKKSRRIHCQRRSKNFLSVQDSGKHFAHRHQETEFLKTEILSDKFHSFRKDRHKHFHTHKNTPSMLPSLKKPYL